MTIPCCIYLIQFPMKVIDNCPPWTYKKNTSWNDSIKAAVRAGCDPTLSMNIPVKISGVRNIVSSPQIRAVDRNLQQYLSLMAIEHCI